MRLLLLRFIAVLYVFCDCLCDAIAVSVHYDAIGVAIGYIQCDYSCCCVLRCDWNCDSLCDAIVVAIRYDLIGVAIGYMQCN
jgi:hypothetical protein